MDEYLYGAMREFLVIEKDVKTKDSFGQERVTYELFADCRANADIVSANEIFSAQADHTISAVIFTIRYVPNLLPTYRIKWRDSTYRITGLNPILPNKGWRINAERVQ